MHFLENYLIIISYVVNCNHQIDYFTKVNYFAARRTNEQKEKYSKTIMPGFTRLYKFSIDKEKAKQLNLNQANICDDLGKKILKNYGSKETGPWRVTTTTYIKLDDVGNETDDLKHIVHMSVDKDNIYKVDMENNIIKLKQGSRSEEINSYHLRREKKIDGFEYMWQDYYVRIGLPPDTKDAIIVEIEHRALSDVKIALGLINNLAEKLITNSISDDIELPISNFDFAFPIHLLYSIYDNYNDLGLKGDDSSNNYTYKHLALHHYLLDV
jgi:hypothetical protein